MVTLMKIKGRFVNKIIKEISSKYYYSPAIVARLSFWYSFHRALSIIQALRRPPKEAVIRVNMLRSNPRYVLEELKSAGLTPRYSDLFREVITIPIEGPNQLEKVDKRIVVKDQAAEEIMMGAPRLYDPGVLEIGENIKPGDKVAIVTKFGEQIAVGVSHIASGEKPSGLVVEVHKSLYYKPNLKALKVFIRGFAYEADLASTQALVMWNPLPGSKVLMISPRLPDLIWTLSQIKARGEIVVVSKTSLEEEKLKRGIMSKKLEDLVDKIKWISGDLKKLSVSSEYFDFIYVHPRSTKTGIRPRLTAFLKERDFIRCSRDAWFLVAKFSEGLKMNGKLLYTKESLDPLEGEYILERMILEKNLKPIKLPIRFGTRGNPGFKGSEFALRVFPDIHDDIGLFACVVTRRE